ncbi:MAG: DUF1761 domain-containing protein [Erythrobacter sp.]|nr:DUF1761 domain-containing protein [Erythrobacter sp.]
MGEINYLAVVLGAVAFFAVGALWYGALFGQAWQRELWPGGTPKPATSPAVQFGLCFVAELLISWMFGHMLARTNPPTHVIWMMAFGFGATIMAPAIAINYLFQSRSLKLFAIDAGHVIVGMLAMGGVYVLLG